MVLHPVRAQQPSGSTSGSPSRLLFRPALLQSTVPVLVGLGVATWLDEYGGTYDRELLVATAQIIPVLLLTLAIEVRIFRFEGVVEIARAPERYDPESVYVANKIQLGVILGALVGAEAVSLAAVGASGTHPHTSQVIVGGALGAGFALLVITALFGFPRPPGDVADVERSHSEPDR